MTPDISYGGWFAGRAARSGHRRALTFEGRTWTYSELLDTVDRAAAVLRDRGVSHGDRVAYLGENHPMLLITFIAAARLGAVFVPLNAHLSSEELHYVISDSGPRVVVADGPRRPVVEAVADRLTVPGYLGVEGGGGRWEDFETLAARTPPVTDLAPVDERDLAIIMYTSGTTGVPKGAMLTHRNLWFNAISLQHLYDVSTDDVTLAVAPLFHIAGLNVTIPTTWMKGGEVVLHRRFDAEQFLTDIERYKVSTLFGVPAMFLALVGLARFGAADLSTVRLAICGGAPVPEPMLRTMADRGVAMLQGYGLTETSPVAIFLVPEHAFAKIGSCGRPALYVESKLIDELGATVTGPNLRGEVCLRGPNVTSGYWNAPEATALAIDPDGWFHTGDVGQYDDEGFTYIVDRVKDVVISGGENVYPAEVENVLYRHPAVGEVAVIGLDDARWGEAVTAVVAVRPGAELDLDEMREFCRGSLARFKIPQRLYLVDHLPRNASGKVLKHQLRGSLLGTSSAALSSVPSPVPSPVPSAVPGDA